MTPAPEGMCSSDAVTVADRIKVWFRRVTVYSGDWTRQVRKAAFSPLHLMSKALPKRNPLPSKEAALFKDVLTLYETRQIKKGIKTADLILKKFPEHGGAYTSL